MTRGVVVAVSPSAATTKCSRFVLPLSAMAAARIASSAASTSESLLIAADFVGRIVCGATVVARALLRTIVDVRNLPLPSRPLAAAAADDADDDDDDAFAASCLNFSSAAFVAVFVASLLALSGGFVVGVDESCANVCEPVARCGAIFVDDESDVV